MGVVFNFAVAHLKYLLIVYAAIAVFSIVITVYDKLAAGKRRRRIPENFLMLTAVCGGAIPMLITMKLIHHKTKHKKFMVGLPGIIVCETILILALGYLSVK